MKFLYILFIVFFSVWGMNGEYPKKVDSEQPHEDRALRRQVNDMNILLIELQQRTIPALEQKIDSLENQLKVTRRAVLNLVEAKYTERLEALEDALLVLAAQQKNTSINTILQTKLADDTPPDSPQELRE